MRGITPPAVLAAASATASVKPAGGVSRSRRHDDRGRRLSRVGSSEIALFPWSVDAIRALNARGSRSSSSRISRASRAGCFTEASSTQMHRARYRRSARRRRRARRRVLLLSAPSGRHGGGVREACDCRKPARGMVERAAPISARSRAVVRGRRQVARRRAGAHGGRPGHPRPDGLRRRRRNSIRRRASSPTRSSTIWLAAASWICVNLESESESARISEFTNADRPLRPPAARRSRAQGTPARPRRRVFRADACWSSAT